jgi:hypothetical protein
MMTPTLNWNLWSRRKIALMAAILALASGAAYGSVRLSRPTPVQSAVLGNPWQCTKAVGFITVCTKKPG